MRYPKGPVPEPEPVPLPMDMVLQQLADRRAALNELDDKLSQLIRQIEAVLRTHIATRITQRMYDGDTETWLCFGKANGRWQLQVEVLERDSFGEYQELSSTPLLSASRELRTDAFASGHVEALIRSAHEQFEAQISVRKKALAAAEMLAAALAPIKLPSDNPSNVVGADPDADIPF